MIISRSAVERSHYIILMYIAYFVKAKLLFYALLSFFNYGHIQDEFNSIKPYILDYKYILLDSLIDRLAK